MRSSASQPAPTTQHWVLMRYIAAPRAATRRPPALMHSLAILALTTRLSGLKRFLVTPPATETWPAEKMHSIATPRGGNNTASGTAALFNNTAGQANTAIGDMALFNNTTGIGNTATGQDALLYNTIGVNNTAAGVEALELNTTGVNNTASGVSALMNNTTGSGNIAVGEGAGGNLSVGNHNIDIGNRGVVAETNTIRIGRVGTQTATFIAGISGETVPTGVAVIIDPSGHLGTTISSARFKESIKTMDKASEAILGLKPVTFRYKHELDPKGISQLAWWPKKWKRSVQSWLPTMTKASLTRCAMKQ
jgi:Chaperone of endosialidase